MGFLNRRRILITGMLSDRKMTARMAGLPRGDPAIMRYTASPSCHRILRANGLPEPPPHPHHRDAFRSEDDGAHGRFAEGRSCDYAIHCEPVLSPNFAREWAS